MGNVLVLCALTLVCSLLTAGSIAGGWEPLLCWLFRHREIHKKEGLYLRRFYLSPRTRWLPFQVFLHHILLDDDDRALHDHPWAFVSIILSGCYREFVSACAPRWVPYAKLRPAGSILFNKAEHTHRAEIVRPVWSLVIATRAKRIWGFHEPIANSIRHVWVDWRMYLNEFGTKDWPEDVIHSRRLDRAERNRVISARATAFAEPRALS